ncbi:MAG: glycosyltransferase family 2 protein [Bacteroidetes bacterium]|nr:glycosyltransferase family 2 protein [Bacteroidota bacterium]
MSKVPEISICIPAYKRVHFLQRLLDSIEKQIFKEFEVVITDDSPDDQVQNLVDRYSGKFVLRYFKNEKPLGTPANWNACIDKASGEWIKIMHDDDWFSHENSLQTFAAHIQGKEKFIFCNYVSIDEEKNLELKSTISSSWKTRIRLEPYTLYAKNLIGPPSVTMIHKSLMQHFDPSLKWLVDIDFYISVLSKETQYFHIPESLINIGLSGSQVTNTCFLNPAVELPEGLRLLEKNGVEKLKNIWVYDAWWRLFRNMHIQDEETLNKFVPQKWPSTLIAMLKDQQRYSSGLLKNGFFSKLMMFFSYKKNIRN